MKVFIIGTGNVAKSLGAAIFKAGHEITGVLGRNKIQSRLISSKFNCPSFHSVKDIPRNSDFYLIAVNDDSIQEIAKTLIHFKGVLLHTSGTVSIKVLGRTNNIGVLYPVESITGKFNLSFSNVPLCIEAGDENTLKKVLKLASSISGIIHLLDSGQRAKLHLAAVFTNNFTNHLLGIATEILNKEHLPPELLLKLAQTTVKNAFKYGPYPSQTGPAKRNDMVTIKRHLELLKNDKEIARLYNQITKQIKGVHNKKQKP